MGSRRGEPSTASIDRAGGYAAGLAAGCLARMHDPGHFKRNWCDQARLAEGERGDDASVKVHGLGRLALYAWSVDGRVTAVLHEGPVDSPQAAVRTAIGGRAPQGVIGSGRLSGWSYLPFL